VTRTVEAGLRSGTEGRWHWRANWFRAANQDDILFVASEQTSFGYFKNFGRTQRDGVEASLMTRWRNLWLRGGYTYLRATFQSPERVNGTGNSTNAEALEGEPGFESSIAIEPGNRIPLVPAHLFRANLQWQATRRLSVDATILGVSSSLARGDENNLHQPDGIYYLGEGRIPGYGIVNVGLTYQASRRWQLFAQCTNLFDRGYATAGQLGPSGFLPDGRFQSRPFAPIDGEYPVTQSTFLAPGAPRGVWGGARLRF
jgi:outer membrane receptor protein involved in Fe transport